MAPYEPASPAAPTAWRLRRMLSCLLTSPPSPFTLISSDAAAPLSPWVWRRAPGPPSRRHSHRQPRYRPDAMVAGALRQRLPLYGAVCCPPAVMNQCPPLRYTRAEAGGR
jgi:hypothetical protein